MYPSAWKLVPQPVVLLLLTDGSLIEVPHVTDVAHKPGAIVCLDPFDAPVASFDTSEVLGYTLNPRVAEAMKDGDPPPFAGEIRQPL